MADPKEMRTVRRAKAAPAIKAPVTDTVQIGEPEGPGRIFAELGRRAAARRARAGIAELWEDSELYEVNGPAGAANEAASAQPEPGSTIRFERSLHAVELARLVLALVLAGIVAWLLGPYTPLPISRSAGLAIFTGLALAGLVVGLITAARS